MTSKAERDARLDELEAATKEWATNERKRLKAQVALSKKILRGRTGSERLNNTTVKAANELLVDEIDEYLTGG